LTKQSAYNHTYLRFLFPSHIPTLTLTLTVALTDADISSRPFGILLPTDQKRRRPSPVMSMLPPEVSAELTQLLQALQSPDNSIRSQAEDHLQNNWTATRPEILLMGLAEQIAGAPDLSVISPFCFMIVIVVVMSGARPDTE
jgi:hypothetical protein